jgi:hypothetical protein
VPHASRSHGMAAYSNRPTKVCYRFAGTSSRGLGHRSLRGAKASRVWTPSGPFAMGNVGQFRLWTYEEISRKTVDYQEHSRKPCKHSIVWHPQGTAPRTGSIANTGRISASSPYSPGSVASTYFFPQAEANHGITRRASFGGARCGRGLCVSPWVKRCREQIFAG